MSLIIKGMKMPRNCYYCDIAIWGTKHGLYCPKLKKPVWSYGLSFKHAECPLSEISTPHGRLIDADRFRTILLSAAGADAIGVPLEGVLQLLDGSPTVVEKEKK